jgi:hypothetical protein
MKEKSKIAVLVISCDKYSDLWDVCTNLFNTFWPDCQYDKFISSNKLEYNKNGFTSIAVGEDLSWSLSLKKALVGLEKDYDYVFTMLEDYYFVSKIDNNFMEKLFSSFIEARGNFLRVLKVLKNRIEYYNDFFGLVENYIPYRQTCVFTLWKISTLKDILKDDENAWQFEKIGVKRGFKYNNFFSVYKNNFKVVNLVVKGKIVPNCFEVIKEIVPDFESTRPFFSKKEILIMNIRDSLIHAFLNYVPRTIKNKIYFYINK